MVIVADEAPDVGEGHGDRRTVGQQRLTSRLWESRTRVDLSQQEGDKHATLPHVEHCEATGLLLEQQSPPLFDIPILWSRAERSAPGG
jgi:hypothetical protein